MNIRKEVEKRLKDVPLYSQEGRTDPVIHCKLFHAYGSGTWYLTEYGLWLCHWLRSFRMGLCHHL